MHLKGTEITDPVTISEDSLFCMEENDKRFRPMCCHFLSDSPCDVRSDDTRLGAEECTGPFGTYEISMPINDKSPCSVDDTKMTSKNCKDFDVSFELHLLKCMFNNLHLYYLSCTPFQGTFRVSVNQGFERIALSPAIELQ